MDDKDKIKEDWQSIGFDKNLSKQMGNPKNKYIGGADFDAQLDKMLFNRMIKLKDLRTGPQGNDPGKIYWDGENKKFKMWVDPTGGWVDVLWTSTSTSTSSTSSSSSSTSTSSTSSSSSSSSSSSTSTT